MEAKAVAKYVRMSPSKLKPVTDLVRGKDLNEALNILKFTPGKAAEIVEKVVKSAAANADVKEMNADNLYVSEVYAHQGPTMKRWKAGAQGRASIILKRSSHGSDLPSISTFIFTVQAFISSDSSRASSLPSAFSFFTARVAIFMRVTGFVTPSCSLVLRYSRYVFSIAGSSNLTLSIVVRNVV